MVLALIKIFILTTISFLIALFWAPYLIKLLTKFKLGKKIRDSRTAPIFYKFHKSKIGTPTMGGILIWLTTLFLILIFYFLYKITNLDLFKELNFLSRSQTLLPLGVLIASAIVGFIDDLLNIKGIGAKGGGMKILEKVLIYTIIATIGAWWFYFKLDWDLLHIPFINDFNIGILYIPIFIFIVVSTALSVNETDGLDGLAGGVLLFSFVGYGIIALSQSRVDLAAFCGVIIGALVAFLWYNIYPAKFFMGDTGAMSLGITLAVIAMLTNSALFLPVIGLILVIESLSVIVQVLSKLIRKKKVFLSTPIHHHFQAKNWPEPQIVMRFWMISGVSTIVGLLLYFLDRSL